MATTAIHLFLNPTAGRGRAAKRLAGIVEILSKSSISIELHESTAVGDLEATIRETVAAGAERIVVAGGDGSIHEAVNGIMAGGTSAALAIIPTGTGNDFAKACGISLDWEHATRLLADRIVSDAPCRDIDVGRCNNRYFANGAGIGFDAKVTRIARSIKLPLGDVVYLAAVFRAMLGGVVSPPVRIASDSTLYEGPLTLANISNGPWVGGLFHIAPMADNADAQLDLLIAKPVTRRRIVALLPKLMKGTHLNEPELVYHGVRVLSIQAEAPMPSHLDGEVQPMQSEFEISLLPAALRLF